MALIGKIRENQILVLIVVGLAIVLFVMMDMFSAGNQGGGLTSTNIGEVNGEKIDLREFENTYSVMYNGAQGNRFDQRRQLWDWYLSETILSEEAEALGLGVGERELADLEFGPNPSPIIRARFSNPQVPGQVDRQQLTRIQQLIQGGVQNAIDQGQLQPSFIPFWRHQRREIRADRIQSKLVGIVAKGMYTPTWMAQMGADEGAGSIQAVYVRVPYADIPNDEISISDDEIMDYMRENRAQYEREEETRIIDYVVLNVVPTAADSAALRERMLQKADELRNAENDSQYVVRTEGGVYSPAFLTKETVSPLIADTIFALPAGSVYGPYLEGNAYKITKIVEREIMADSADTRHILIGAQTPEQFTQASERIDSLQQVIEAGGDFAALANEFSTDQGSNTNGGRYDNVTPGQFVKPYDDVLFRTGRIGELYKVRSQFGYHLIEVLSRSANTQPYVKLAYIVESIVPSNETQEAAFTRANQLFADNNNLEELRAAVADAPDMELKTSLPLSRKDYRLGDLGFSEDTRSLVCWAFTADEGDLANEVFTYVDQARYFDSRYVVAALSEIVPAGLPTPASVRETVVPLITNRKKAELIESRIAGMDLEAVAQEYATQVDTLNNLTFNQNFVNGLGNEPKVLATAFQLPTNQVSEPVAGETGVYLIKPLSAPAAGMSGAVPTLQRSMNQNARGTVASNLIPSLLEAADIEDNTAEVECLTAGYQ
jgi:peptidyl-prolyl cis-trans isomerase D